MLITTSCAPSEQEFFKKRKVTLENILDKYLDQSVIEDYFGAYKPTWNTQNYDQYYSFVEFIIYYMYNFKYSGNEEFMKCDYDSRHDDPSGLNEVHFSLSGESVSNLKDKEYISLKDLQENRIYPLIIEEGAFYWCTKLQAIEIPDSVMWIEKNALSVYDYSTRKHRPLAIKSLPKNLRFIGDNEVKWMNNAFDLSTLKELRYLGNNVFNNSVFNNSYKVLPPKLRYLGSAFNKLLYDKNKKDIFDRIMFPKTLEAINGVNIFSFKGDPYFKNIKNKIVSPINIVLPENLKYFNSYAFSAYCPSIIDFRKVEKNLKTIFPESKLENFVIYDDFFPNKTTEKLDWIYHDEAVIRRVNYFLNINISALNKHGIDVNSFVYKLIFPQSWKTRIEKKVITNTELYPKGEPSVYMPDLIKKQVVYK